MYGAIGPDPSQDGITEQNSFLKSEPAELFQTMYSAKQLLKYYYGNLLVNLPAANNQNFSDVLLSSITIDGTPSPSLSLSGSAPYRFRLQNACAFVSSPG
jgi:hypothetical protein